MQKFIEKQKNSQIKIVLLWEAVHEIDTESERLCEYFDIKVYFKPQSHSTNHLKLLCSNSILIKQTELI